MGISMADLYVPFYTDELAQAVYHAWSWLVPAGMTPILLTTMGDVFFADAAGVIHRLDTMRGEFERVARNADEFKKACATEENLEEWFLAEIVSMMHAIGRAPAKGKVLSWEIPMALGGEAEPDNLQECAPLVHIAIQGQILDQLREIPDGASITGIEATGPDTVKVVWEAD